MSQDRLPPERPITRKKVGIGIGAASSYIVQQLVIQPAPRFTRLRPDTPRYGVASAGGEGARVDVSLSRKASTPHTHPRSHRSGSGLSPVCRVSS